METYRYFKDFSVGESYTTLSIMIKESEIIGFASQFDPQPMHLDRTSAIASGWHTASLTMKLFVTCKELQPPPGSLGLGVKNLKWLSPVCPGDWLHLVVTILALRRSESHPDRGIITYQFETVNQNNKVVQVMESSMLLPTG